MLHPEGRARLRAPGRHRADRRGRTLSSTTSIGVESTARAAGEHSFNVVFVEDATTTPTHTNTASPRSSPGRFPGVQVLRSGMGRGYRGPEAITGHGAHRYVFQLFALATPIMSAVGRAGLDTAGPRAVLAAARGPFLARGRLDGLYSR